MKFTNLIIVIVLICSCQFLRAQISGKVIEAAGASSLEYASVVLYNTENNSLVTGVITDAQGFFSIKNIKSGSYYVKVSFIGYQLHTTPFFTVQKKGGQKNIGTIKLAIAENTQLSEVIIKTEKNIVLHKIDRQVFDTKKYQSAVGGSAIDVVRNLPSVTVNSLGDISIRGSRGFAVLINGKPTQGDVSTILAQLPANALETVELITAPSAKYDPEGKGGILNIITKKGAIDGMFAQLNVRGGFPPIEDYNTQVPAERYGLDATVNKRNGNWNFSFGASYQRNDISGRREGDVFIVNAPANRTTFLPSDGERSFDDILYNGRFNVTYTPNNKNEFSLGLFAGKRTKDRLADIIYNNSAVSPIGSDNLLYEFTYFNHNLRTRRGDFALGSLDFTHKFENNSKLTTSFLYEYTFLGGPTENDNVGFPDMSVIFQREFNTNDNPLFGARFNLDYQWKPFKFWVLETGYQYRNLNHTGKFLYERDGVLVPEFSSDIQLKRIIHAAYAQLSGTKKKWDYNAGFRLETMDREYRETLQSDGIENVFQFDFVKLFPSVSLQYKIDDKTNLKTAYSKRVERTTTFKMNSFAEREHSEVFEQGDNRLQPEFIDLVELGINKKLTKGNSFYANAYYRHVTNVINRVNTLAYQPNGAILDSIINRVYANVGRSNAVGLEVGATLKPTKNWTNFIGANVFYYNVKGLLNFRHRDGVERNYDVNNQSSIYSLNLNSTYTFWQNASVQFTFNYLSNRATALGEDSRFYSPNLTFRKRFLDDKLTATLQWQNIDMGVLNTNEQRITTARENEFFTTTNYVYEVDVITLNLSYTFNAAKNKSKFIESEFGKREF